MQKGAGKVSEAGEGRISYSPNIVALCLDSYSVKRQDGRLYHQYIAEPVCFTSLIEALGQMEGFYDELCFPFATTEIRSFRVDRRRCRAGNKQESAGYRREEMRRGGREGDRQESAGYRWEEMRRGGREGDRQESAGYRREEIRRKEMKVMETFDDVIGHRGTDATFVIRVQHRQHSSWQGELTWVDKQKKEYFRSALELVRLIDGALEGTAADKK